MTRGKASQSVNARLRRQLADAEEARRRLEHRVKSAERERDDALARMQDALDNGHPELREAIARERHREEEIRRLAAESDKYRDYLRDTLHDPIQALITNVDSEVSFMTPNFTALLHELFGTEFYAWLAAILPGEWTGRGDRREQAKLSPEEIAARMEVGHSLGAYHRQRGLQAVEDARQRRLAREGQPAQ